MIGKTDYFEMPCPYGFDAEMFVKNDSDKPRYSLIPPLAEAEMAKVLTFGAHKYEPGNWRKCDDLDRYVDAALRHIAAYRMGKWTDEESELHHLAHAMCCLAFVVELNFAYIDDKKAALEKSENQP